MLKDNSGIKLIRNTLANGVGALAGSAISVLMTPFLIQNLGLEIYGIWILALTLTFSGGYLASADLGIETATACAVAEARSDSANDYAALNRVVSTTAVFFTILGLIAALAMMGLAWPLTQLFHIPKGQEHAAFICFLLIGSQIVIELPTRTFIATLEGAQKLTTYQAVEFIRTLIQSSLWAVAIITHTGLVGLSVGLCISTLITFFLYWSLTHRAVPGLSISYRHASRHEFRGLFSFGKDVLLLRLTSTLYNHMDKFILASVVGSIGVGVYEVANKIYLLVTMVGSLSISALLPTTANHRGDQHVLRDIYLRGTCYTAALSASVAIAAFFLAGPLIEHWIGSDTKEAVLPAQIFALIIFFNGFHNVGSVMVIPLRKMRKLTEITLMTTLMNLLFSVILVHYFDVVGVVLGTALSFLIAWPIYLIFYTRNFDSSLTMFKNRVLKPNVLPTIGQGIFLAIFLFALKNLSNLPITLTVFALSCCCYMLIFLFIGLKSTERNVLFEMLRSSVRPSK